MNQSVASSSPPPHLEHVRGSAPSSPAPLHLGFVGHGAALLLADLVQEVVGLQVGAEQTEGGGGLIHRGTLHDFFLLGGFSKSTFMRCGERLFPTAGDTSGTE